MDGRTEESNRVYRIYKGQFYLLHFEIHTEIVSNTN
jgi:hypothetical protein